MSSSTQSNLVSISWTDEEGCKIEDRKVLAPIFVRQWFNIPNKLVYLPDIVGLAQATSSNLSAVETSAI